MEAAATSVTFAWGWNSRRSRIKLPPHVTTPDAVTFVKEVEVVTSWREDALAKVTLAKVAATPA
jgi:hypothetical protein